MHPDPERVLGYYHDLVGGSLHLGPGLVSSFLRFVWLGTYGFGLVNLLLLCQELAAVLVGLLDASLCMGHVVSIVVGWWVGGFVGRH